MTTVTIDRKHQEEAKRACAFLNIEAYYTDHMKDSDQMSMIIVSEKGFEIWHLARVMQMYVSEKMYESL
jgi:hypothetical protein